ncbi:U-actitoxin-Avd3m like protein [Argiope bruennichi]|uniref:U-actitoxin-Avd3m like protein n=2 Tax=Argiope bruennichi TaxID=94029 RepID=A0A8T0EJ27_ARGBR|nr:U-actitoxin-Avd3m like protein [Argiope bruennichi]
MTLASFVGAQDNSICYLPPETGPCRGLFFRYYYDDSNGRCELFRYGGCRGNANNFRSREECEDTCVDSSNSSGSSDDYGSDGSFI